MEIGLLVGGPGALYRIDVVDGSLGKGVTVWVNKYICKQNEKLEKHYSGQVMLDLSHIAYKAHRQFIQN